MILSGDELEKKRNREIFFADIVLEIDNSVSAKNAITTEINCVHYCIYLIIIGRKHFMHDLSSSYCFTRGLKYLYYYKMRKQSFIYMQIPRYLIFSF